MPSTKERRRELYRLKKEAKAKEIEERKKKNSDRCKKYYLERKARKIMDGGTPQQVLGLLQSHIDHGHRVDDQSAQRDRAASKRHENNGKLLEMVLKYVQVYIHRQSRLHAGFSFFFLNFFPVRTCTIRNRMI